MPNAPFERSRLSNTIQSPKLATPESDLFVDLCASTTPSQASIVSSVPLPNVLTSMHLVTKQSDMLKTRHPLQQNSDKIKDNEQLIRRPLGFNVPRPLPPLYHRNRHTANLTFSPSCHRRTPVVFHCIERYHLR